MKLHNVHTARPQRVSQCGFARCSQFLQSLLRLGGINVIFSSVFQTICYIASRQCQNLKEQMTDSSVAYWTIHHPKKRKKRKRVVLTGRPAANPSPHCTHHFVLLQDLRVGKFLFFQRLKINLFFWTRVPQLNALSVKFSAWDRLSSGERFFGRWWWWWWVAGVGVDLFRCPQQRRQVVYGVAPPERDD